MRAVVQRVSQAAVEVEGEIAGQVSAGLLVYLGVGATDTENDAAQLAEKVGGLRIFPDERGVMNLSVIQAGGEVLVISAFTTQGDARRGRRPSYEGAARAEQAAPLYRAFCDHLARQGVQVETGRFQETMRINSTNVGPVCILLDSQRVF